MIRKDEGGIPDLKTLKEKYGVTGNGNGGFRVDDPDQAIEHLLRNLTKEEVNVLKSIKESQNNAP